MACLHVVFVLKCKVSSWGPTSPVTNLTTIVSNFWNYQEFRSFSTFTKITAYEKNFEKKTEDIAAHKSRIQTNPSQINEKININMC